MSLQTYFKQAYIKPVDVTAVESTKHRAALYQAAGLEAKARSELDTLKGLERDSRIGDLVSRHKDRFWIKNDHSEDLGIEYGPRGRLFYFAIVNTCCWTSIALLLIFSGAIEGFALFTGLFGSLFGMLDERKKLRITLVKQKVQDFSAPIPQKAVEILIAERKKGELQDFSVWSVQRGVQSLDPLLVGFHPETKDVAALLYAWGEDLEKLDIALDKTKDY